MNNNITLEKIDIIRERTGASYTEAKEALEHCEGKIVDALIYIENKSNNIKEELCTSKDELIKLVRDIIKKGNVNRIRIKKNDRIIADIPVNAGIAAGLMATLYPPIMAIGLVGAVVTKITIEIVKDDGSVEVVNKIIKDRVNDAKEKVDDITYGMKEKMGDLKSDVKGKVENLTSDMKERVDDITADVKEKFDGNDTEPKEKNVYQYTVNFQEVDNKDEEK